MHKLNFIILYGNIIVNKSEFNISCEIEKKFIQQKKFNESFIIIFMTKPIVIMRNFRILFFKFLDSPRNITVITEHERITKPIMPDVLNNSIRIIETVNKTLIPDGIPYNNVARYIGNSEKSSFKNGNTGNNVIFPKKASTKDITEKTELCTRV